MNSVLLCVSDMKASLAFYRSVLGLSVVHDFGANKVLSGGLALQTVSSYCDFIESDCISFGSHSFELYFETEDFDAFLSLVPSLTLVHPVKEHAWGQRVVRFYDPDRHIIEVGESMKAVCARFVQLGLSVSEIALRMDVPLSYVLSLMEA